MDWRDIPDRFMPHCRQADGNGHDNKGIEKKRKAPLNFKEIDQLLESFRQRASTTVGLLQQTDGELTYKSRRDIVAAYRVFLDRLHPNYFITYMPGRRVTPEAIIENIEKWACRIERVALGRYWSKHWDDRIRLIAFLEKPDVTPHYHAVAYVPEITVSLLESQGSKIWKKLMPAGKLDIQPVVDLDKVISYVTKDLHHYVSPENVMIYAPIRRAE